MIKTFILAFLCLISLSTQDVIAESIYTSETHERCYLLGNEFASTMNAKDFQSYRNLATWGIKNCKTFFNRDEYYYLYANLALADNHFGDFSSGLKNADYCITQKFNIPDCHAEKVKALFGLKRINEGLKSRLIALSVTQEEMFRLEEKLKQPNLLHSSQIGLYKALIVKYDAIINMLNSYID